MDNIELISRLTEIAGNVSTISILLFMVLAFGSGRWVSRETMESILKEAENRTAKLVGEILESLRGEVRDGVRDALDERRKDSKDD